MTPPCMCTAVVMSTQLCGHCPIGPLKIAKIQRERGKKHNTAPQSTENKTRGMSSHEVMYEDDHPMK
eukprot:CAMPEP_0172611164 /NCGR_PEP_ID=MMETSP1068-20121228/30887_1 /TAXON_ID=35684 /ORGANISM="Pseudopedinella elastica, Strain CCMP716" /LENGTH=66 /DNA_ID=CAMNT_0013415069 /DNA_START=76 /DNA_END=276 /DNA_ORIENTATION=-